MRTALWVVYAFLWIGGVISGGVSASLPWAAPFFLVLAGSLALLENRSAVRSMLLAAALGFVFEIVGVHSGYPFGPYRYTHVLAPSILGVPIAIAFAWLILIDFVRGMTSNVWIGALLMTAIDLLIDPLAAGPLGYWEWLRGGWYYGIPSINFLGWFASSLVILSATTAAPSRSRLSPLLRSEPRPQGSGFPVAYIGWSVIAFFALLALTHALYLPAAIGLSLLALPFCRPFWSWRWPPGQSSETPSASSPAS